MNKNFLLITLILLVSPSAETKENINYFDAMDVFDLEWASDPQVSSDGETIVYVRKSNDIMKDRVRSSLWRIAKDGRDHRPLNSGLKNSYSPRWSSDNKRIAFVSNNSGSTQIHMHWVDTGETAVISQLQESPSSLSWSPDGKWLAFTMRVKAESKSFVDERDKPDGASWTSTNNSYPQHMKKNNTVYKNYIFFAYKSAFLKIIVNIEISFPNSLLNIGTKQRYRSI